jgi:hypothetical protein
MDILTYTRTGGNTVIPVDNSSLSIIGAPNKRSVMVFLTQRYAIGYINSYGIASVPVLHDSPVGKIALISSFHSHFVVVAIVHHGDTVQCLKLP